MVWAGFIVGLLGSLHCIGMCGPIALALPIGQRSAGGKLLAALLYNIGRAITYAAMGLLMGIVGQTVWLMGLQQGLSIAFGVVILLVIVLPLVLNRMGKMPRFYFGLKSKITHALGSRLGNSSYTGLFTIGLLNGLLPCGFVYIGLAGAAATGTWYNGAMYMALFGLGTLPLMLALILLKHRISLNFRQKINQALPYAMAILAVLFIVRGMNLGIPYLSPKAVADKPVMECCKHKAENTTCKAE